MNWGFLLIVGPIVAVLAYAAIEPRLAARAFRSGLVDFLLDRPLNLRWSQARRDGWVSGWNARRRAYAAISTTHNRKEVTK